MSDATFTTPDLTTFARLDELGLARRGRELMQGVIHSLREGVPAVLVEVRELGRTLARRAEDVLAYFDRPRTPNGPPRRSTVRSSIYAAPALGFRNLTHYIARCLLEAGGFRPRLHPGLV